MRLTEPQLYWLEAIAAGRVKSWWSLPWNTRGALEQQRVIARASGAGPSRAAVTDRGHLILAGVQAERRRARQCAGVADG